MKRLALFPILVLMALPAFAGIHYKAVTTTTTEGAQNQAGNMNMKVEGWVSSGMARVEFKESDNPVVRAGAYLITKDGGKTIYLVDPQEKTYAKWDLQAMFGLAGAMMQGMGPLLKMEFSDPKVEKLLDEDGGAVAGQPTRHTRYRTSYSMKIKVLGMGNESSVVTEQDIWSTDRLQDVGLGIWLRSDPVRTGNEQFDKLIAAEVGQTSGFPLKTVAVSTTTPKKGNKTTSRSTMQVTELDTSANVAAASFEIPAGYQETQLLPTGEGEGEASPLGGLLRNRNKKKDDGD